jgi:hypothetical protein
MRRELLRELADAGVDVERADDRTLAEAAARRLMERSAFEDGFTTFLTDVKRGRLVVPPELRDAVRAYERELGRSIEEQWERELYADGMFAHRVHGSCTSSATYLCGGLRAAGIPARIVYSIPLVDANDPEQLALVELGIRHHRVRAIALEGLSKLTGSWASHTFNEVLVGGRWRRLNYARLGQPILDAGLYGLTTHVLTVRDWADARMGLTIGRRQELDLRDDVFRTRNPYRTLAVSDEFGVHAEDAPLAAVELTDALWAASPERPAWVGFSQVDLATDRLHVLLAASVDVRELNGTRLRAFWDATAKDLVLRAPDGTEVPAPAVRGYWTNTAIAPPNLYFVLRLAPDDRERMIAGGTYTLSSTPAEGPRFRVAPGVRIAVPDA